MTVRVLILCLIAFALPLVACSTAPSDDREELLVAAAASLKDVMTDLGAAFEATEGVKVSFNFAGSNLLQRQIETGAPADLFASAADAPMDVLASRDLIIRDTRKAFATNTLVLITPQDSPHAVNSFDDLTGAEMGLIALGGDGVPIRLYSEDLLRRKGLWDSLSSKFIFGANTRQVLAYVARGETDAGLVYRTDAVISDRVRIAAQAEPSRHRPIAYPVAVISGSRQEAAARRFIAYIISDAGQKIIRKHGFGSIDSE